MDDLLTSGNAISEMLSGINPAEQIKALKKDLAGTKATAKKDALIKKIKYLDGLQRMEVNPQEAYVLHNMPVLPPITRPAIMQGGNRIEHADVSMLYRDHMLVNNALRDVADVLPNDQLLNERKALYDGAKAIVGLGDAITGNSRGAGLKGLMKNIGGMTGPKQGFFHSKLLSKKQDFSGRAVIYAEPNLGFNEAAVPKEILWKMYEYHLIRDLVKNGYDYASAKKAVEARNPSASASLNKLIKEIPVILNRPPTLMRSNVTAHFPVPTDSDALGINPLLLPLYAGDFDGDALTIHLPMSPEAIKEAKEKLLPESHVHDYRKGLHVSQIAPGHEAVLGALQLTEPDVTQKAIRFKTEQEALLALKEGRIKENTPISIG